MQWMQYEIGPESDFALEKKKKKSERKTFENR